MKGFFLILGAVLLCFVLYALSSPFAGPHSASAQIALEPPARLDISFKGGAGDTPENAVVISGAPNSMAGISAEYHYLGKQFGRQNVDWKLQRQSVLHQQGRVFDRLEIELPDGGRKTVFFDISEFFGKL